ncbi:hypothetical protein C7441_106110 [Pseudaminobacter salicylatoxidans]|uniref:Anti-sigma factor NepR domain-containing protein n=1 Tax=Pseudaminobacter salicylatoxidans TaxID=93369 RepID=A0A316C370_PSESE|nr:hypothetical protein [Pseudaminobacter salicylatoxidans]PWJ84195.1 hypothetical protein C7441_106110 [Pseudaminobacter salicylatoxidans]
MARGNNNRTSDALALEIRRQFGSDAVKRFVRALPAFKVDQELPRKIRDLLGKLDHAEDSGMDGLRRKN